MIILDLILILAAFLVPVALSWQTSRKFNIPGTFILDGTAKAFERNGEFRSMELAYRGHYWRADNPDPDNFDDWWVDSKNPPYRGWLRDFLGGFYWVGIPFLDQVAQRNQRWMTGRQIKQGENRGAIELQSQEKRVDYVILVDDIYYAAIDGCETSDKFAVRVIIGITMCVGNPRRAWYKIQNWIEATVEQLREPIRLFVGSKEFDKLRDKLTASQELLNDTGIKLRTQFIHDEYGVVVKLIQIADVIPEDEEVRKATHQKYIGEQNAARREAEAEGEAKAITKIADAEAKGIAKRMAARKENDPTGTYSLAEAIHESKPSTLVLGSGFTPSIPVGDKTGTNT